MVNGFRYYRALEFTVIHTTLVGLEPATFRSLVQRATSSATEPTKTVTAFCLLFY